MKKSENISEMIFMRNSSVANSGNNCWFDLCACDDSGSCESCSCDSDYCSCENDHCSCEDSCSFEDPCSCEDNYDECCNCEDSCSCEDC